MSTGLIIVPKKEAKYLVHQINTIFIIQFMVSKAVKVAHLKPADLKPVYNPS